MHRLLRTFAAAWIFFVWSGAAQVPTDREIDEILADLTKITGLKPQGSIARAAISRSQVRSFLEERIKEVVKPAEIRAEELTLKKFGFVPPGFDLAKSTVELLEEQAAAFYDFRKKKLFLLESGSIMTRQAALVHELAHALADQNFRLDRYIEKGEKNDDGALARLAVMEGQASWLMSEYVSRRAGQSMLDDPAASAALIARSAQLSEGQFPVLDKAPRYMRETLLFPYTAGMLFQHRVAEKLGQAGFSEVFRRPPQSTQQILHPEKYLERFLPARPAAPEVPDARRYKELARGGVGELDLGILLRQYVGEKEAAALAPRWRGGVYRLLEGKSSPDLVLAWASEWSDDDAAREFFKHYRRVLESKWETMRIGREGPELLEGRGDDGHFLVRLDGPRVSSLEGLPAPLR